MYICLCKGLDQKSLDKMRQSGIDTLKKVINSCGAGGDCGTCAFKINRYLQDKAKLEDSNKPFTDKIKKAE